MKDVVIFLRKKIEGQNSIEELAYSLRDNIDGVRIEVFPEYSNSLRGILKNVLFAIRQSGAVNHLMSPAESYILPFVRGKKIVTWHDLGTVQERNVLSIKRYLRFRLLMIFPMSFVDKVVAISQTTSKELESVYSRVVNKTLIIPNSYDVAYKYKEGRDGYLDSPRILHIGTGKRKNLERVIQALEGVDCYLYIVGLLTEEQRLLLISSGIKFTQEVDVSRSRIIELYQECDIVSFPSLYEGFGMIVIEAGVMGRPVLTSKEGALLEVAKDSVCYVDPTDVNSIRSGFMHLINDPDYRKELIDKGRKNAEMYSPQRMFLAYEEVYRLLE